MPRGHGIYDEQHRDEAAGSAPESGDKGKRVPEDTPDVDTPDKTTQEPPD
jgi:hypothetical protein